MSQKRKEEKSGSLFLSLLFSLLTVISSGAFCYEVTQVNILPEKYRMFFYCGVAALDFLLVLYLLLKKKSILAKLLSLLMSGVMVAGAVVIFSANTVLKEVSNINISTNAVGIYVKNEDPSQRLMDVKDYTFGIMQELDRANTDLSRAAAEEELGQELAVKEYISVLNLADAMREGEINAILVNSGYLSLLKDDADHLSFLQEIRPIWSHEIVRALDPVAEKEGEQAPESRNSFVVYISGNDTTGELEASSRSDVNILMAINPDTGKILLVNTPRDYYVETPVSAGDKDKLTHAGVYGVDISMATLASLYHIPVDHYVRLNFSGFVRIIDALGGVKVENDTPFTGRDGSDFPRGTLNLNGHRALVFARERYAFADGDRKRGENHQELIKGVIDKATSPAILTNYAQLIEAVSGAFETDFSQEEISDLVQKQLSEGISWEIASISVDGSDDCGNNFSMPNAYVYRMIPNMETVANAEKQMRDVLGLPERE